MSRGEEVPASDGQTATRRVLVLFTLVVFISTILSPLGALAADSPAPTISSDKADYAPGELISLTGANWQPGEDVHISVNDDTGSTWTRNVDVVADATGAIFDQFNLPDWFVATYSVVATGQTSGVAGTTFTDSNPLIASVASPTSATVVQGGTATFGAITVTKGGNNNACSITLGAASAVGSGLPVGAALVFGQNPLTMTNNDVSTSVAVATSSSTPPGTYTFAVHATNGVGGCQGPGAGNTNTLTLTINAATVNTSTTAAHATATFGDASVTLSATVSPNTVNVGNVVFTVKSGATTIGTATSGTVVSGSATAAFSLLGVNAETYTIEAAYGGGTGFNASNNSGQSPAPTLSIGKADADCTVTGYTVTYDGDPHTATGSCTDLNGDELAGLDLSATTHTDANSYTDPWTFTDQTGNYNDATGTVSSSIGKADATCSISGYSGVYDAAAHGASGSCLGVGGEDAGSLALGDSFTNVPGGTAHWVFTGNGNYHDQSGDVAIDISKKGVVGSFTAQNKLWDGTTDATVMTRTLTGVISGDDVFLSGGTAAFATPGIGCPKTVTLTGATIAGADVGNYELTSVNTSTACIGAAYRIEGFYQPVDMTLAGATSKIWNSAKGGSTVPLKFRVYSVATGAEITTVTGISARVLTLASCTPGVIESDLLPGETGGTSLRYSEGQFIFNWQVPKAPNKCYQVLVESPDGNRVMSGPGGSPASQEAYIRTK
jgi:hypothetical protein